MTHSFFEIIYLSKSLLYLLQCETTTNLTFLLINLLFYLHVITVRTRCFNRKNTLVRHLSTAFCIISPATTDKHHVFVVGIQWNSSVLICEFTSVMMSMFLPKTPAFTTKTVTTKFVQLKHLVSTVYQTNIIS